MTDVGSRVGDDRLSALAPKLGDLIDGAINRVTARRVLVVDDNRDAAESLAVFLQLSGHTVHTAYDGIEGVEAAEAFRPDIVLLDIGMPNLNGYEACRRIRNTPWGKNMTVIAQTGWVQDEDKRRTSEAGFDGHLVKPVDPAAVIKIVAALKKP